MRRDSGMNCTLQSYAEQERESCLLCPDCPEAEGGYLGSEGLAMRPDFNFADPEIGPSD